MAVEYGTIGIRPRGEWDPDTKYDLLNLVVYDGSSYVAHTAPPKGTLPTDTAYWQVSAQGTGKATADSVGTVKPDGTTTEVSTDGALSVKQATQTTAGIVKGSEGIKVGEEGSIDVDTNFTQATELANIIAGEAIANVLGKVSKSIATTMNLDQNALLKNMLTNIDVNDSNKVPTSAFVHTLVERIDKVNSDLDNRVPFSPGNWTALQIKNGAIWNRLQLHSDGKVVRYTSADSGVNWNYDDIALSSDLEYAAKTNGDNTFIRSQYITNGGMGVDNSALSIIARTDQNIYSRPSIYLDCYGTVGGALFLDTDGQLKLKVGETTHTINMT